MRYPALPTLRHIRLELDGRQLALMMQHICFQDFRPAGTHVNVDMRPRDFGMRHLPLRVVGLDYVRMGVRTEAELDKALQLAAVCTDLQDLRIDGLCPRQPSTCAIVHPTIRRLTCLNVSVTAICTPQLEHLLVHGFVLPPQRPSGLQTLELASQSLRVGVDPTLALTRLDLTSYKADGRVDLQPLPSLRHLALRGLDVSPADPFDGMLRLETVRLVECRLLGLEPAETYEAVASLPAILTFQYEQTDLSDDDFMEWYGIAEQVAEQSTFDHADNYTSLTVSFA